MKLRHKVLFSTGLVWILFLLVTAIGLYPLIPGIYWIIYVISGLITFGLVYVILYFLITRRVEELKNNVCLDTVSKKLELSGNDELTAVASQVNRLLDRVHHTSKSTEDKLLPSISQKELELSTDNFSQLAHYDSLTSLPNRVFFNEMLNKTLSHAQRHKKVLAILFLDLDRFKNINDALGMEMGDEVLKKLAIRFNDTLRSGDVIARLGGDEFIVLLNDIIHPKYASSVAEKLLQVCAEPIKVRDREFFISASIGICIFPADGSSLEDLQKNADLALYKAKHAGGGVFQYFSKEMTLEANKHIKLESALQHALGNNEFVLYYQPQFNLKTGTVTGVEALIRWINPEIGLIAPNHFIHQAEENGLIIPIGEWVLYEACRANKSWQNQGYAPINIAVNISPKQFSDVDLAQLIKKVLKETELDAKYLQLEITEMTVMENVEATSDILKAIKDLGVKVCIDDFGTGYTSISYLKKFPVDILKIDQTYVKGIQQNQNDRAITSAIIALGHNLGIQIIAEGVETADQLQFLTDHHCDLVQGYYFSRPLPEQKMILQLGGFET